MIIDFLIDGIFFKVGNLLGEDCSGVFCIFDIWFLFLIFVLGDGFFVIVFLILGGDVGVGFLVVCILFFFFGLNILIFVFESFFVIELISCLF